MKILDPKDSYRLELQQHARAEETLQDTSMATIMDDAGQNIPETHLVVGHVVS